jgi:hypothetical protein
MEDLEKLLALTNVLDDLGFHLESMEINDLIKSAGYNSPRVGKKRWSVKQKKRINCSSPKGFSQKQYCKRKRGGGKYKS